MKPVIFHAEAKAELREAVRYYQRKRAGLGVDCRTEIQEAVRRIQRNPTVHKLVDEFGTRRCLVNRFPFAVIFREVEDVIWIGAVAHHGREPGY